MARVDLDGLGKRFGGAVALDDVSLTIEHGRLACLLGPSGCGKTTTLRLLAGFMAPDSGAIRVGDRVVSAPGRVVPPERRNMSMIFQSYALWPHMTIAENVGYGLETRKVSRVERGRRVGAMLEVTRLGALAGRYPHQLSGGQQQRAALARALVVEPDILLLDEPLSNLDANLREEMRREIRRLHLEYRFTTAYVTHDHVEAMTTADLVVVMNNGRIEQAGTPEDIYERPCSAFVARFVGNANLLSGRTSGGGVDCGGVRLDCANRLGADGSAVVAIRPHRVQLAARGTQGWDGNAAPGVVERQSYLGQHRDYVVVLADGQQLRVTTAPELDLPPGAEVQVHLPPAWCRALPA